MKEINDTINEVTRLEIFPTELFISIFEYLTVQELEKAFVGLNHRIDAIIQSMSNMSLTISPDSTKLSHVFQPHQFIRLSIPICSPKKLLLSYFSPQLRSLIIKHPTSRQMEDIQPHHFPFLEYLHIQGPSGLLCHFIFSNQFPYLSKINLIYVETTLEWSQSPSMRFVHVFSDKPSVFMRILESCPNMQTFIYKGSSMPYIYTLIEPHGALKYLSLTLNYYPSFEEDDALDKLLSLLPNLNKLSLSAGRLNHSIPFDFLSLSKILRRWLLYLKHFTVVIQGCPPMSDSINHLHPLFRYIVHTKSDTKISSHQIYR